MNRRGGFSSVRLRPQTLGAAVGLLVVLGSLLATHAAVPILWQGSYGGNREDTLTCALATEDGGYLLGGYSHSDPSGNKTAAQFDTRYEQFWLVKVDSSGGKQWDQSYWGGDRIHAMARATGGGYLLGGESTSGVTLSVGGAKGAPNWGGDTTTDYWVICVSTNGARLWDQSYGSASWDYLAAIAVMPDGGYLLGGASASAPSGNKTALAFGLTDIWVVRTDAQGNKLWDRSYGGAGAESLGAICATADGGALLCGASHSGVGGNKSAPSLGGDDFWVVRIDGQGNKVWDSTYGGSDSDFIHTAAATPDGGFLLAGGSESPPSGTKTASRHGLNDMWVVRIASDGTQRWDASFGGVSDDLLFAVAPSPDGGFILAGYSYSPPGGTRTAPRRGVLDGWVVSIDAQGQARWDDSFGGSGGNGFDALLPTPGGGFLLAGYSDSGTDGHKTAPKWGSSDYWIVQVAGSVPPVIEQQPENVIASGAATVHFRVSAFSFAQPVRYQWRFMGTDLPGATTPTLILTNVQPGQAGRYTVLVSNQFASVESQPAMLIYTDAASLALDLHPTLTIYGTVGQRYRVEYSQSLSGTPQWAALGDLTLTNSPQLFVDVQAAVLGQRLYRVLLIQ